MHTRHTGTMQAPLSPFLYLRRNPGRTAPMLFVIVLAVTLVASVVSIVRSIDLTVFTLYGYNRYMTGLTPRNALTIDADVLDKVRQAPGLGSLYAVHSYQVLVKTIFGKMPLPLFGLSHAGREEVLARSGQRLVAGRMLRDGAAEAVVADAVARNLGLKVGDVISRPDSMDAFAPAPIRLVGLLHGPVWLGLTSKDFVDANSPFTYTGYIAFARAAGERAQRKLDAEIDRRVDKGKTRVWKFEGLVDETRSALSNLYLILDIVVSIIVFAISFVCGLLANIYFTQRLPEIATLYAIGYSRALLLGRAVGETALLCVMGWLLGLGSTVGLLAIVRAVALTPKGLLLNICDPVAFVFTSPLPVTIILFALVTIGWRLASLDPVSIIERRG